MANRKNTREDSNLELVKLAIQDTKTSREVLSNLRDWLAQEPIDWRQIRANWPANDKSNDGVEYSDQTADLYKKYVYYHIKMQVLQKTEDFFKNLKKEFIEYGVKHRFFGKDQIHRITLSKPKISYKEPSGERDYDAAVLSINFRMLVVTDYAIDQFHEDIENILSHLHREYLFKIHEEILYSLRDLDYDATFLSEHMSTEDPDDGEYPTNFGTRYTVLYQIEEKSILIRFPHLID